MVTLLKVYAADPVAIDGIVMSRAVMTLAGLSSDETHLISKSTQARLISMMKKAVYGAHRPEVPGTALPPLWTFQPLLTERLRRRSTTRE